MYWKKITLGLAFELKKLNVNANRKIAPMGLERITLFPGFITKKKKAKIGFQAWSFSEWRSLKVYFLYEIWHCSQVWLTWLCDEVNMKGQISIYLSRTKEGPINARGIQRPAPVSVENRRSVLRIKCRQGGWSSVDPGRSWRSSHFWIVINKSIRYVAV